MFDAEIYIQRREKLKKDIGSGLIFFPGNNETPMNYRDNPYLFRQDSSFLYFWGLDYPNLAAVIDVDKNKEMMFGNDLEIDDVIWTGPQPTLADKCEKIGVTNTAPFNNVETVIKDASNAGRKINFLPQYRADILILIEKLLGIHPSAVNDNASVDLIKAVVKQRNLKIKEEIEQIEQALDIAWEMHMNAMMLAKTSIPESVVSGAIEGIALSMGSRISFPVIFSIHGETLHNHYHGNIMRDGDIAVNDSGAESALHYASDITRTIPISGKFSDPQKAIYEIVLKTQLDSIAAIKPGTMNKEIHLLAAKTIASGLKDLGLMKGSVDEAVAAGAHAMFFPHGLGHMMGLDVHDMENLGENYVGYDETVERSDQFGLAYLRLAKALKPGFVLTVEPGIYFIPELIDMWKAEKKHEQFIDYEAVEKFRGLGGIRLEDDILVTEDGHRVLGKPIPKTIKEVEAACSK